MSNEWNHGIPPVLKNILDHYTSEYRNKPAGIVSYSGGPFGGIRSVANTREILSALGMATIPSSFAVSKVQDAFDEKGNAIDENYDRRVVKFLEEFEWYVEKLKT